MNEEILLEVKPKFYILSRVAANFYKELILTLSLEGMFMMLITVFIIATNASAVINLAENNQLKFIAYILLIMVSLIVIIFPISALLFGFLDKRNFEVTSYKIYNDRIDFDEGFINHKHSSILFKDIKETHIDQNFIQRKYNVATIRFITAAKDTSINFQDIENFQLVHAKIKGIHEKI